MNTCPRSARKAFTLTEILVVIAVIGVLAGLIFTSFHFAFKGTERQNAGVQMAKAQAAKSEAESFQVIRRPVKESPIVPMPPGVLAAPSKSQSLMNINSLPGIGEPALVRSTGPPKSLGAAPQEYIVVFTPGVTDARTEAVRIAKQYNGRVLNVFTRIRKSAVVKIPDANYDAFRQDLKIAYLERNMYMQLYQQTTPTGRARIFSYPALPPNQLVLRQPSTNAGGTQRNINMGRNPIAGNQMVNVAVIDSGIDPAHPDLNLVKSLQCSDASPLEDIVGHGTHCAGIIGAKNNGIGVIGIYPGAPLWSMRIDNQDGTITNANILQAFSYLIEFSGTIRIANMSFGGGKSAILDDAANACALQGVVMVAAAGNNSIPASFFSPASAGYVVCVAAMGDTDGKPGGNGPKTSFSDPDDTMASFSNWGDAVHVIAPGVDINSTIPVAQGSYGLKSGTSMACPNVVGYLSLLMDQKTIFGRPTRNFFYSFKPGVAISMPDYVRSIATETVPGILGDPLIYPMVNFRIQ